MNKANVEVENLTSSTSAQPSRRFTIAEIQSATNNFEDELVIGQGGFGKVYKGQNSIKESSHFVAIKWLDSMSDQGAAEFKAEIQMLSKLRHCNLVSLIGYYDDNREMILVYVYMPRGTLYDHLHKVTATPLSWIQRLKIAIGDGHGLDYLHTGFGTQHGVIHRDVKSSNILLDENWATMILDFGLSKIGPIDQTTYNVSVKGKLAVDRHIEDKQGSLARSIEKWPSMTQVVAKLQDLLELREKCDSSVDSTPDRFIQIVASIEQTNDLDDITLDEIVRKLKAFEERIKLRKRGQVESQENLLFAHGEHSKRGRRFGNRGGRSNFSRGNWQRNRNKHDSKEEGSTHKEKSNTKWNKREREMSKIQCHKCGKLGHFRKNCKESSTTQEESNLILEDDEPSLLMATHETKHEEVLLNEGQIQPGKYVTADASMWYLDNGASNHMTGIKSHFRDIDESVTGRIRCGDRSYVQIKGKGSILLGCKNNEQKIVSDIYYIPNLKSNILSLGQLTEIGCKIIMDGKN
nr:zinc finger, CCHC-type [Tanacetum cinerariifolium]